MNKSSFLNRFTTHPVTTILSRTSFLVVTLTLCLWLLRVVEFLLWYWADKIDLSLDILLEYSLYFDFLTAVTFSIYSIPLLIVSFLVNRESRTLEKTLFVAFLVLHLVFTNFYYESSYLLGNEMSRYSISELVEIVLKSSDAFFLISLGLVCISLWFLTRKLFRKNLKVPFSITFSLLTVILLFITIKNYDHLINSKDPKFFKNRKDYFQANNKLVFFLHSNVNHFTPPTEKELAEIKMYPYLREKSTSCNLCSYFPEDSIKPNLVIILVESLSSSFSGQSNYLGSFTPFLDSLASKSLYWPNCLSATERTYGAIPAILSSTSNGTKKGMLKKREKGEFNYPFHTSILTLLNDNRYSTCFGYSDYAREHEMDNYLNHLRIGEIYDRKFVEKQQSAPNTKYRWGYGDDYLFKESIKRLSNMKGSFFELLLTTSIHHPFDQGKEYLTSVDTTRLPHKIMSSVVFSDQKLKEYLESFSRLESFKRTIFVIVGDHNIGDLPLKNELETFRVPLFIYSPMLTKTESFKSVTSHKAIYPAITSLLENNFNLSITYPRSGVLDDISTHTSFTTNLNTSLCLYHEHEQTNLIMGKYLLRGDYASEIINENLDIKPIKNRQIIDSLKAYKKQLILEDYKCEQFGYQLNTN